LLFVLDDTSALGDQQTRIKDALALAVSRIIHPACSGGRSDDPFAPCDEFDLHGYRDLTFAFLMAGSSDASPACRQSFATHGGGLVTTERNPDGMFRWTPTTWTEHENGAERLEELVLEIRAALDGVAFFVCERAEPFEALFRLLVDPDASDAIRRQRIALLDDYVHPRAFFIAGSDDQSGPGGGLDPLQRYVNLFRSEKICLDDPRLAESGCASPTENPAYLAVSFIGAVGPMTGDPMQCAESPLPDASRPWMAPGLVTRIEELMWRLSDTRPPSHPWCFPALDTPDDPRFLFPLMASWAVAPPEVDPPCQRLPHIPFIDRDLDSLSYGQASCRMFELNTDPRHCSCDGEHRAPSPRNSLPAPVVRKLKTWRLDGCVCELFQFAEADLDACQHVEMIAPKPYEPKGWCALDPERGVGNPELVRRCPTIDEHKLRFLGPGVPASGAIVVPLCEREECGLE
jgi:hypothetical protein